MNTARPPNHEQNLPEHIDVVFINSPHHGPDYYSPIGIGMLSVILEDHGFTTQTIDFQRGIVEGNIEWPENFFLAAEDWIRKADSDVFAFSVMSVSMPWATRLARICRRLHPASKIVFGGPHASLLGAQLLTDYPYIDVVARREGETIIIPLISALVADKPDQLRTVPNLIFQTTEKFVCTPDGDFLESLDGLPFSKIDLPLLQNVGILSIEAGRGCPYHCSFCSSHSIWSRKPRFKSPKRLIEEAERYIKAVPNRTDELLISFEHDDFLANRPWFLEFARTKIDCSTPFRYGITARVNHITEQVAEALASSGCISVFMGLETGSERLQTSSSKHLKTEDILPRVRKLISLGIHISTNFIVGFPDETWDDIIRSFEMMFEVRWAGGTVNISVMCPEPGSLLGEITPLSRTVLLLDDPRCDELRRGGIDIKSMKQSEAMHLTTIRNDSFDIIEVSALARCLQLLLSDYPLSITHALEHQDHDVSRLIKNILEVLTKFGEVTNQNALDVIMALHPKPSPQTMEFALYEHALAAHQRSEQSLVPLSALRDELPKEYSIFRRALNQIETRTH